MSLFLCLKYFSEIYTKNETLQVTMFYFTFLRLSLKVKIFSLFSILSQASKRRSVVAVWTRNEVYLGYTSLTFVKIMTTEKLGEIINIPPAGTLTIHNADYTGHPLELGLLLNYCVTCDVAKEIHLIIYNEDTKQWVLQDFVLKVTADSFLTLRFLYSAMPELILWDKHRVYYCYNNFTNIGVLQTPTTFGNLSGLSHDSIIHDVFTGEAFSFCKEYPRSHNRHLS